MKLLLIVSTLAATLVVSPIDCQIYPSNKLFAPILESVCYSECRKHFTKIEIFLLFMLCHVILHSTCLYTDELMDACGNDVDDLNRPGYQVYCMFSHGGVYEPCAKKDQRKPKATLNFPNVYARFWTCFKDEKYISCAYKIVYDKYKDTTFDLTEPGSANYASLQNTLAQLYNRKEKSYC